MTDLEISSTVFKALAKNNPRLRRLILVEGSLLYAMENDIVRLHKIT